MLTEERTTALRLAKSGHLRHSYRARKGGHGERRIQPSAFTVAAGYLLKADLIQLSEYGEVTVTGRGEHALRAIQP